MSGVNTGFPNVAGGGGGGCLLQVFFLDLSPFLLITNLIRYLMFNDSAAQYTFYRRDILELLGDKSYTLISFKEVVDCCGSKVHTLAKS